MNAARVSAYNDGYDGVPNSRPSSIGIGASLSTCWDSGKEDNEMEIPKKPRCGQRMVAGRKRRTLKKSKKSRRKTSKRVR